MSYTPDRFVVIDYGNKYEQEDRYAILAGWWGNFVTPDSWKRSSPIVKWEVEDNKIVATTFSGSKYVLLKDSIGVTMLTASLIAQASLTVVDVWEDVLKIIGSIQDEA